MEQFYSESKDFANSFRVEQLEQLNIKIQERRGQSELRRSKYFCPDFGSTDSYLKSTEAYRTDFINMLGWPLNEPSNFLEKPTAKVNFVAEDSISKIYRLDIEVMPGVTTYGLLFLPKIEAPYPLVISQHGGGGTPELCSSFFGSFNYNDMTRRVLSKGCAVFAPQLLLWEEQFGPKFERSKLDISLKQLGGSIASFDIFKIIRSIDYFVTRDDINANQIGMIGLSYGGFYTMFTTAIDLRIKSAVSSCFLNNRFEYNWDDWVWFNSGNTFLDSEVCGLICPRPLYIEVGNQDELFDISFVHDEYKKINSLYGKLKCLDKLKYKEFNGVHELDKANESIDFLYENLINS